MIRQLMAMKFENYAANRATIRRRLTAGKSVAILIPAKPTAAPQPATPPRAPAAAPVATKPAPPAPNPAAASPAVSTATLEALADHVFGSGALPSIEGMSNDEKRAALTREFWMAHLSVPGLQVSAADAHANHWRRAEKLSGVFATIRAYRQARVNAFLGCKPEDNAAMPRAAFNALSPRAQSEFCRNNGRITE